jgi:hypothetical protein
MAEHQLAPRPADLEPDIASRPDVDMGRGWLVIC